MRSAASFPLFLLAVLASSHLYGAEINAPNVKDPQLELTLFAAEPDIVTPIGIAIDRRGRLFVVESHTHFPKPDYPGPKRDRVKVFDDTNGDGKPDKIYVFADDLYHSMNLAFAPEGALYLTHRNGVIILRDQDGDGISEARATVLQMETPGNYPHNGVSGIAFSADGWLYIGMGENLGARYTLRGSDGSSHSGGGEGGNVFRCRPDGSELKLVATGFWNAFALAFNRAGILFCVDNDPDSRPPCRLLDVVEGADFGYKFRFGRSGLHPFTAWNGELPGTLPMIAGTGEAPSGILDCDSARLPASYHGTLLVTSWGDHAIERYRPVPVGASVRAEREVIVQGEEWFRPVGIAAAPEGTIYFTDWVDQDYSVHRKGRIWRLRAKPGEEASIAANRPEETRPNPSRLHMQQLLSRNSLADMGDLLKAGSDADPFIRSGAITALSKPIFREALLKSVRDSDADARLTTLLALRRAEFEQPAPLLKELLADKDERIRLMALVWAGEDSLTTLGTELDKALTAGPVSTPVFRAYNAARQALGITNSSLTQVPSSAIPTTSVRTLEMASGSGQDIDKTLNFLKDPEVPSYLRLEAIRTWTEFPNAKANPVLIELALDRKNPSQLRAEAVLALTTQPANVLIKLGELLDDPDEEIVIETARAFRFSGTDPAIRSALEKKRRALREQPQREALIEQLALALQPVLPDKAGSDRGTHARPATDEGWRRALTSKGSLATGRRVFFSPVTGCGRCHRIENHGGQIGPDLSTIARSADREKLMQSVLNPSREIAPLFVSHSVETKNGESYTGALTGQSADGSVTLLAADGKGIVVPGALIASLQTSTVSLMPEDLENAMTVQDFRDLLVYLLSLK